MCAWQCFPQRTKSCVQGWPARRCHVKTRSTNRALGARAARGSPVQPQTKASPALLSQHVLIPHFSQRGWQKCSFCLSSAPPSWMGRAAQRLSVSGSMCGRAASLRQQPTGEQWGHGTGLSWTAGPRTLGVSSLPLHHEQNKREKAERGHSRSSPAASRCWRDTVRSFPLWLVCHCPSSDGYPALLF